MNRRRRTSRQHSRAVEALETRVLPTTFTVTNFTDTIAEDDGFSLREAIMAANRNPGEDTIILGVGRVKLQSPLEVTDAVIIVGAGQAQSSIDGLGETNLFENTQRLTLQDLKLKNGANPNDRGGAVHGTSRDGGVVAQNVTFQDNSAGSGGAISTADATVIINDSLFDGNTATNNGGAIAPAIGMTATITGTLFLENTAGDSGGALYGVNDQAGLGIAQTDYQISGSQFVGNQARLGGAILAGGNSILIDSSRFADNNATGSGGAIYEADAALLVRNSSFVGNNANENGGAIDARDFRVVGSSLLRNTAGESGGAVFAGSPQFDGGFIFNSTIAENDSSEPGAGVAGNLEHLESSIIASNAANGSLSDLNGSPVLVQTSFIGTNAGTDLAATGLQAPDGNGNLIGSTSDPIDPLLAPDIETAGSPAATDFLPLELDSPARGGGSNSQGLETDQIGAARVAEDDGIDIGAVEFSEGQAEVVDGVVTIEGTSRDDRITITLTQQNYLIQVNGSRFTAPLDVEKFEIRGLLGNDLINVATSLVPTEISAGSGNDTVVGGSNDDTIRGGGGHDTLRGLGGDDSIGGGAGSDTIRGAEGRDFVDGHTGHDLLFGGLGADELRGAAGNDTVTGGDGNDVLFGGSGNDTISGDDGNDIILAGNGSDYVSGGNNHDYIRGANGSDTLDGGRGRDYLFGEGGTDELIGSFGSDILLGGRPRTEPPSFAELHSLWTTSTSYDSRVDSIRALFPGLDWATDNNTTAEALDDGAVDTLSGGRGLDFFYAHEGTNADTFDLFDEERHERV